MKKVLFTTMSIIAVAAMMLVSCKKDNGTEDNGKDKDKDPVEQYTGPVEGTENWAIIGTILGANWDKDYKAASAAENIYVVKNVKLEAGNEFKWRDTSSGNGGWDVNRGGAYAALGEAFDVVNNGANIKPELDGIYDIYLNLAVDQAAIVAKDGAQPTWKELPEPIEVDGNVADWAEIEALTSAATSRIRSWKFVEGPKNLYFYFALRKNRIDGKKLTIGFNTDKDATTGSLTDDNAMKGCEAIVKQIIPFTNATEFLKGTGSGTAVSTAGESTENAAICWGYDAGEDASSDSSNIYVEVCVPKSVLGLPKGAEIEIGASYDYYFTNYVAINL